MGKFIFVTWLSPIKIKTITNKCVAKTIDMNEIETKLIQKF